MSQKSEQNTIQYEKGLTSFAEKTLKSSLAPQKEGYEESQIHKKRAVIQLIEAMTGKQRRFYKLWLAITEKTKTMKVCRQVSDIFLQLNFAIKSVADVGFIIDPEEKQQKVKALHQLYLNLALNFSDAFKRWRDINTVEKIRSKNFYTNKERLIKVLERHIHKSKRRQISEVVEKFRQNKTVTEKKKIC